MDHTDSRFSINLLGILISIDNFSIIIIIIITITLIAHWMQTNTHSDNTDELQGRSTWLQHPYQLTAVHVIFFSLVWVYCSTYLSLASFRSFWCICFFEMRRQRNCRSVHPQLQRPRRNWLQGSFLLATLSPSTSISNLICTSNNFKSQTAVMLSKQLAAKASNIHFSLTSVSEQLLEVCEAPHYITCEASTCECVVNVFPLQIAFFMKQHFASIIKKALIYYKASEMAMLIFSHSSAYLQRFLPWFQASLVA